MKINEIAKLTGTTIRTLHYYDEIGLLQPSEITRAGYRQYDEVALVTLQQILFFRELDFPLNQIKEIMASPSFDKTEALKNQKKLLLKKRERLDKLIRLVDEIMKGDNTMSFKEFDTIEIEATKKKYAWEVKKRWGNTDAYAESQKKESGYAHQQWQMISTEGNDIFKKFAANMEKTPEAPEVQTLVKEWQAFISEKFYHCTNKILQCLSEMYVNDERFKANIDRHSDGLAVFMSQAIAAYCEN